MLGKSKDKGDEDKVPTVAGERKPNLASDCSEQSFEALLVEWLTNKQKKKSVIQETLNK